MISALIPASGKMDDDQKQSVVQGWANDRLEIYWKGRGMNPTYLSRPPP